MSNSNPRAQIFWRAWSHSNPAFKIETYIETYSHFRIPALKVETYIETYSHIRIPALKIETYIETYSHIRIPAFKIETYIETYIHIFGKNRTQDRNHWGFSVGNPLSR